MPQNELQTLLFCARKLWWIEQGHLPEAGGLNDQSATFVDATERLAGIRAAITEKVG